MPLEYNIVMYIFEMICEYLTSIMNSGPMYTPSYSSCSSFLVTLLLKEHPLSQHLEQEENKFNITADTCGEMMLMSIVRAMVDPTVVYHSTVKSVNSPENIGKKVGRDIVLNLALTSNIIIPYIQRELLFERR
jgi:hypothetical protein